MNKQDIQDIFDYWNLNKGSKNWWGHRKISFEIEQGIIKALETHSVEDICAAIDNYALVLLDDKYFWTYSWTLYSFLTVKNGKTKDATYKWWQFLPDNFIVDNYLKEEVSVKVTFAYDNFDKNPELTKEIIEMYKKLINNFIFVPNEEQIKKFILAAEKMTSFFLLRGIIKENWIKHTKLCLIKNYVDKGDVVYPGNLSSDHFWNIIMSQYLLELGCS